MIDDNSPILPRNIRSELRKEIDRVKQVKDQVELARIVADCFVLSLERLLIGCVALRQLEEMGHDMNTLRFRGGTLLKKAAYGQILPEIVLLYLERPVLAQAASNLPITDQRRIVDDEPVHVMTGSRDDHMQIKPSDLTTKQIRQVYGRDAVRNDVQQLSWIREHAQRAPNVETNGEIIVDTKRNGAIINGRFTTHAELASILVRLSGDGKIRRRTA